MIIVLLAKKYPSKSRSAKTRSRDYPSAITFKSLWLLIGIFLGISGSYICFSAFSKQISFEKAAIIDSFQNASGLHNSNEKKLIATHNEANKNTPTRFDFYKLLPKMEVPSSNHNPATPVNTSQKTGAGNKVANTNISQKTKNSLPSTHAIQYLLQTGNFKNQAEANELKARLVLQGLNPHIQNITHENGQTWFQVTLGPFTSEQSALLQKKRLEEQKIRSSLIVKK